MTTQKQDLRQEKGLWIAEHSRLSKLDNGSWKVPAQNGSGFYYVKSNGVQAKCNCPDFETRRCKCKHIWAVQYTVTKKFDKKGNMTSVTETKKVTYSQDWHNYNLAQTREKELFMKLLADLTNNISNNAYNFGRPKNPLGDTIYSMIFKVYSTFSGRRFNSDIEEAVNKEHISKKIPYNSMFDYFNKEELTPILSKLVTITALPLKSVENKFNIDSTGFGTSNFQRGYSFKHGKEICSREWVKCHFMNGAKTNIIAGVKITSDYENDCPQFEELYNATKNNFNMEELSGDKAYLSRENLELAEENGTDIFIPFKSNSKPNKNGSVWKKMYHYFMFNNEEFLEHYHSRSNAESTVNMIKSKFGDSVRSKNWTAQVNEVLCKCIAHNICCCIMEMHTLEIKPNFENKDI